MKTIFALLLIFTCTEAIAQNRDQTKNAVSRFKARFHKNNGSTFFAQQTNHYTFGFKKFEHKQSNRVSMIKPEFAKKEKSNVLKTLGRIYVKNGAAGIMGSWMNNIQLTLGWRYQPLRILTSEQPVPVHPFMMRVRVRI